MAYATLTDLQLSVGGAAVLNLLLDKDGDGIADVQIVIAVLDRASSEADSALQVRHALPLSSPFPSILTTQVANLAAYYAHQMGTDGQGVPPNVRQMAEDARAWFDQLAAGTRTLGVPSKPASDRTVQQVDTNPLGGWVTRESLKGFW